MTTRMSIATRALAIGVVVALTLAGTAMGEVLREGLVGEWHFDGDAKDSSGNGNDGIIYGANFVDGKFGKALSFDGVNDYVWLGSPSTLKVSPVSIESWFKTTDSSTQGIIYRWRWYGEGLGVFAGKARFWIFDSVPTEYVVMSTITYSDGAWHQAVGVYTGSQVVLYVDGIQVANAPAGTIFYYDGGAAIGRDGDYSGYYFNGLIDEVRIYNSALNAKEVKANYEAGQKRQTTTTTSTPTATPSEPESSAVLLHGEKTDVVLGEDVLLKLSAVNLITKPPMTVQVLLYPPSGMSVTSSEFVKSGAGIYTTTYSLNPGDGKDIEVRIQTNQVGEFNVKGRIVYYFGDNQSTAEDHTLNLPIKVRKESEVAQNEGTPAQKTPGFGIIISISVVLVIFLKKRK